MNDLTDLTQAARETSVIADQIPPELLNQKSWVCWRFDIRDGKSTKVPVSPATGGNASTADLDTWGTYLQARTRLDQQENLAGLGFVFAHNDHFLGIDIDNCVDPFLLEISPEAQEIIKAVDSYTEYSQSGTGIHIICRAEMPQGRGRRRGAVEFYSAGRYFIMTGRHVFGSPTGCMDRQGQINSLLDKLFPPKLTQPADTQTAKSSSLAGSDTTLLDAIRAGKHGDNFDRLWAGNISGYDNDQSRADAALLSMLRFWTGGDKYRSLYLFTQSALGQREKWQRADYRESTWASIDKGDVRQDSKPQQPETPDLPEVWYDSARKEYLLRNARGVWLSLTEAQFRTELRALGINDKVRKAQNVSDTVQIILDARHTRDVDYAGPLAGYKEGFYEVGQTRLLVTQSPVIIQPVPGKWPILCELIDNMLIDPICDQRPYLYGWLKVAYEALRVQAKRPGQALVIAGPHECGKSLLQQIITLILGGRFAKPYQYMMGLTQFNYDLFMAEHLMIEDEPAGVDIRLRRAFGSNIRQITANDGQRAHAKNRTPVNLFPFWRLTITLNDEPENLMILPPIDDSLEDKLIILKANKKPIPMPTETVEERAAFWSCIKKELPAFMDFLINWKIPDELRSQRYGITHYHHPEILHEIDALAPESRLMTLLQGELFQDGTMPGTWSGTAVELEKLLTANGCDCQYEARKLLSFNTACGVYLARLARKHEAQISRDPRYLHNRIWHIKNVDETNTESEQLPF